MSPTHPARLSSTAVEIAESLYQHRLLSTRQIHDLHTPDASMQWAGRLLARIRQAGLADNVRQPGGTGLWYLTPAGAQAVETIGNRAEDRRKLTTPAQAAGPLQQHTLAVNDIGIAFVNAARARGHRCGPFSWRHEIAHPIGSLRGQRRREVVIADALLTYELIDGDQTSFHYRFLELDRTTLPTDALATKLTRYARLYHHTGQTGTEPLWTERYTVFPAVLVALTNERRARLEQRRRTVLAICADDRHLRESPEVQVAICLADDLDQHGPFAPIFRTAGNRRADTDWLGNPA